MKTEKVAIVGSGVSALVCAINLEKKGYSPNIYEASAEVGGRVKTDFEKELPLDHGFQVLLTQYPLAKKYLNYQDLKLQKFLPGSLIYKKGKLQKIGDPSRSTGFLLPTLLASIGSFSDKFKILKLSASVKKKSIEEIFEEEDKSTLEFLKDFGFSDKMIENFFLPFYTGIFLEPKLETSARKFQFVFKMFAEGHAAIPQLGMQEIPKQLKSQLINTSFHFGKRVQSIEKNHLVFDDNETVEFDLCIDCSNGGIANEITKEQWNSCHNFYFETNSNSFKAPIIALVAEESSIINNLHFVNDLSHGKGKNVVSVTIVKDEGLDGAELEKRVRQELENYCEIKTELLLKHFHIIKALPLVKETTYGASEEQMLVSENLIKAGDCLANGSLNSAMLVGEQAADLAIRKLELAAA